MFDILSAKHTAQCYLIKFFPRFRSPDVPYNYVFVETEEEVVRFIEDNLNFIEDVDVFKMFNIEGVYEYVRSAHSSTTER